MAVRTACPGGPDLAGLVLCGGGVRSWWDVWLLAVDRVGARPTLLAGVRANPPRRALEAVSPASGRGSPVGGPGPGAGGHPLGPPGCAAPTPAADDGAPGRGDQAASAGAGSLVAERSEGKMPKGNDAQGAFPLWHGTIVLPLLCRHKRRGVRRMYGNLTPVPRNWFSSHRAQVSCSPTLSGLLLSAAVAASAFLLQALA
ncbi:hypothetical protein Q4I28_004999 [Leishmania naiffi]|uniref:Uncharacterized protein n=1 Tax=Leishmania naiffi TaxID=5678 RepID=A0AAW3BHA6_9TRYP